MVHHILAPVEEEWQGEADGRVVGLRHAEEGEEEVGRPRVLVDVRRELAAEGLQAVVAGRPDAVDLRVGWVCVMGCV